MTVPNPRTYAVTFRLSYDEYTALKKVCASQQARSISEFARDAILRRAQERSRRSYSFGEDLATVGACLEQLDEALVRVRAVIQRVLGDKREDLNGRAESAGMDD